MSELEAFVADGGGSWDPDTVASEGRGTPRSPRPAGLAQWAARSALDGADGRDTRLRSDGRRRPPRGARRRHGFCFFNNAAVAAQTVLDDGAADRVAVFDWDVHHGNGTQDVFYDRGDVFYASIHEEDSIRIPERSTRPATTRGGNNGEPPAFGRAAGADDLYAIDEAVAPALERFDPDLVIVSAGFDAHRHDPISRMRVSSEGTR